MGWGEQTPPLEDRHERVLEVYGQLWHRARRYAPALTLNLPAPHELRTGQTPNEVMDRLRRGIPLHDQDPTS